jgi:hypothetical protein
MKGVEYSLRWRRGSMVDQQREEKEIRRIGVAGGCGIDSLMSFYLHDKGR